MKPNKTLFSYLFVILQFGFLVYIHSHELNANGENEYLAFAEEMPSPIGGMGAIVKNIKYPIIASKNKIEGTVYLQAFIAENGTVEKVIVLRDIGGGCGDAAVEAVKNVKFTPGKVKGSPVKVKLSLPIKFKLQ